MEMQKEVESIERSIAKHQETVRDSTAKLAALGAKLVEARAALAAETAKTDETRFSRLRGELAEHLAALDQSWNPATERRVVEIMAAFRQARKSGNSWEALNLYIEKLKNPSGGRAAKRTWSGLLNWVKQEEIAA